jgi:arylamine N-acetyltransferase
MVSHIMQPSADLFDKYLRLLGVAQEPPSREALYDLATAHVERVPFESVSKLYYRKRYNLRTLPGLERYLEGIEKYHFGGTCYSNNHYLNLLLDHLGFEVKLCGADMANPDVHLVNIVTVEGHEYLVDAGYGAPFLEPFRLDVDFDQEVVLGRDRFVLKPRDDLGHSRLEFYREAKYKHGYTVKPIARSIEFFERVIAQSFTDEATFMNAVLLVRFGNDSSTVIHNLERIEARGAEWQTYPIADRASLPGVVEEHFGVPGDIVSEAIADVGEFGDAWN